MIKLLSINKTFKEKEVFKDLNLEINKGEIIGLLGPNGEGKSTLVKILAGLITDYEGNYDFDSKEFDYTCKNYIGYMNDTAIIPQGWRVTDAIDYYKRNFITFNNDKVLNLLESFEIDIQKKMKEFSKGAVEKIHLALALSIDAKLYILDEPLASIDLIAREEVIRTILDNFNFNSTIIIVSHLVRDVEKMLDRVILLKDKKIEKNVLVEDLRLEGKSVVDLYKEVFAKSKVGED